MTETVPLIQEIRDRFEPEDGRPVFADPAITSGIAISSTPDSYAITAFPRYEYGYEGFVINAQVLGGIFSDTPPARIETTFDDAGVMAIEVVGEVVSDPDEDGLSLITQELEVIPTQTHEGIILPGDPGFELFEQLQARLAALKEPVINAMATLGMSIDPRALYLREPQKHGASYSYDENHKRTMTTLHRSTRILVESDDGVTLGVDLDARVRYPEEDLQSGAVRIEEDPLMVYQSGTAYSWRGREKLMSLPELDIDSLVAFSGLYATIRKLYR